VKGGGGEVGGGGGGEKKERKKETKKGKKKEEIKKYIYEMKMFIHLTLRNVKIVCSENYLTQDILVHR
jgi:hypothetical protein